VRLCAWSRHGDSVLVVTFANEQLEHYHDAYRAALEAGYARIRPVLMTALAMIIGMVPMALGLGEGGEQNAPLGLAALRPDFRHRGYAFLCSHSLHDHQKR
jgi:Cu/Ag efflux pump CusA